MPRRKRVWYPGAVYHVMSRGNHKGQVFKDDADYLAFLQCVDWIKMKYSFTIHSLCLMTNHFHILLETADTELSKIMQGILSTYAEGYNHKYGYTGHLFEGRFTSCLIEDDVYFLEVSRYIHLNPVKAFLVQNPFDYDYSSYAVFAGEEKPVDRLGLNRRESIELISNLTEASRVLAGFGEEPKKSYCSFVEGPSSEREADVQKDIKEDEMWLPL